MKQYIALFAVLIISPAFAQDAQPVAIDIKKEDIAPVEPFPEGFRSLFFTKTEHDAVLAALAGRTMDVPAAVPLPEITEGAPPPPRILHLSGIVYATPQEWSVWLNGQLVTPSSSLPEIRAISVEKESVALKWYDAQTQTVIPVRLSPQQRFNIDTRTFMPGMAGAVPVTLPPESSPLTP